MNLACKEYGFSYETESFDQTISFLIYKVDNWGKITNLFFTIHMSINEISKEGTVTYEHPDPKKGIYKTQVFHTDSGDGLEDVFQFLSDTFIDYQKHKEFFQ